MTVLNWILSFLTGHYFNRKGNIVTDVVMTLHECTKMLFNMWSYNFYDMTLSTEQQRLHMINYDVVYTYICLHLRGYLIHEVPEEFLVL